MTRPPQIRLATLLLSATAIALAQADVARARLGPRFMQKAVVEVAAGSGVSTAVRRPTAAGNLIVAYVVWDGAGAASVSDSSGNAYVSAVGPTHVGSDATQAQLFFAADIVGGPDTVSAAFTARSPAAAHSTCSSTRGSIAAPRSTRRWRCRAPLP